jgi:hypothetical protein
MLFLYYGITIVTTVELSGPESEGAGPHSKGAGPHSKGPQSEGPHSERTSTVSKLQKWNRINGLLDPFSFFNSRCN